MFDLHIWDNASTDETPDYLKSLSDARLKEVTLSKENPGPTQPMNSIWSRTNAELVGKVDNDCLLDPTWADRLSTAHADIPQLGAIACWHFRDQDFSPDVAGGKLQTFNSHQIFRHPWVCGSGFLLKRSTFERVGPCPQGSRSIGLTGYFLNIARAGMVNGWYYPFVQQEHMDDPLSPHCVYKDDATLKNAAAHTYTMREHKIKTYQQRLDRRKFVLENLHFGPWTADSYVGLRGEIRRIFPVIDRIQWKLRRAGVPAQILR
jgi:glycosyltransferase involved in cell wall biosynthesis